MQFIDLQRQYQLYKDDIDQAIHRVLDNSKYILGPEVSELEKKLAEFVGVSECITVASGTDALEVALMALEIGPGDEVITVPFTWISTAEAIKLVGATPVFVDIVPDTYNIDIDQIEAAITPRTKAIIPVSLFGQMPDYTAINAIAKKHGLYVIEDAAQSFGATQRGKQSGSLTTMSITSFFPAKPFGCYGDGGAIFTNNKELATKSRAIRTHGGEVRHDHHLLGMNSRFDTIQAAILLAKLPHFPKELELRANIAKRYNEALSDCCTTPIVQEGNTHTYAQYTVRALNRAHIQERLRVQEIPTAVYYPVCLHEQPIFKGSKGDFPIAEAAAEEVLSLPMHPWLTEEEQEKITNAVRSELLANVG